MFIPASNLEPKGSYRIPILLPKSRWPSNCKIAENTKYTNTSTKWTSLKIDFTQANYGIELLYDGTDLILADVSFSSIMITRFVY